MVRKPAKSARAAKKKNEPGSAPNGKPLRVRQFMTKSPHTIGRDQTLAYAHTLMNKHGIRHLPVLEGGRLVGLLSQRDLYFVESLDSTRPAEIQVDEAMSTDVSEVRPDALLQQVVAALVRNKHGCAVVTQDRQVVGVFSTVDAMKALLKQLRAHAAPKNTRAARKT